MKTDIKWFTVEGKVNGLQVVSLSRSGVITRRTTICQKVNKHINKTAPDLEIQHSACYSPVSFSRTSSGYLTKSFLMVTSNEVHSSRLSFWATTLSTKQLKGSAIHAVLQMSSSKSKPVKVFIETALVVLSDGSSQSFRKFIWEQIILMM